MLIVYHSSVFSLSDVRLFQRLFTQHSLTILFGTLRNYVVVDIVHLHMEGRRMTAQGLKGFRLKLLNLSWNQW